MIISRIALFITVSLLAGYLASKADDLTQAKNTFGVSDSHSEIAETNTVSILSNLLPAARDFDLFNLSITKAGFTPPAKLPYAKGSPQEDRTWPSFYVTYCIRASNNVNARDLVRFNGLFGPEGTPLQEVEATDSKDLVSVIKRTLFYRNVSPTWKSVRLEFEVRVPHTAGRSNNNMDSSRLRYQDNKFQGISFEIPVQALAASSSLKIQKPPFEPIIVRGKDVEARWETEAQHSTPEDFDGTLWLRTLSGYATSQPPSKRETVWLPREVKGFKFNTIPLGYMWVREVALDKRWALHSDNSLRAPFETSVAQKIQLGSGRVRPKRVDLHIKVERVQQVYTTHLFKNVPIPKRGEIRDYWGKSFSDGSLTLRYMEWVTGNTPPDPRIRHRRPYPNAEYLRLTFEQSLVLDNELEVEQFRAYDDTGLYQREIGALEHDTDTDMKSNISLLTLQIKAPSPTTKTLSVVMHSVERQWSGQTEELVLPNVPVPRSPYTIITTTPTAKP